jgi:hypothetical protein
MIINFNIKNRKYQNFYYADFIKIKEEKIIYFLWINHKINLYKLLKIKIFYFKIFYLLKSINSKFS